MKRTARALVLLAAASGCVSSSGSGTYMSNAFKSNGGESPLCGGAKPTAVAGVEGPWGQPVVQASYNGSGAPGVAMGSDFKLTPKASNKPIPLIDRVSHSTPANDTCEGGNCAVAMGGPHGAYPGLGGGMPAGAGGFPPGAVAAVGALGTGPGSGGPFM